jgi:hypothetical protein
MKTLLVILLALLLAVLVVALIFTLATPKVIETTEKPPIHGRRESH